MHVLAIYKECLYILATLLGTLELTGHLIRNTHMLNVNMPIANRLTSDKLTDNMLMVNMLTG